MTWTAWQYRDVFDAFYQQCDDDTQRSIDVRLDQLLEKGNLAKRPVSAPLEDGIFELRAKKAARLLFFFQPGQKIIFVVGIFKDQREVPREAIEKAKEVRKTLLSKMEKARGIYRTH
jgi:hypothetical protein